MGTRDRRSVWLSRRALAAHLGIIVWVPGCVVAAWWQVTVAMAGNGLAYLYAVEWPVFAVFGIVVWWNFCHDEPGSVGNRRLLSLGRSAPGAPPSGARVPESPARLRRRAEEEDAELRAYNDYLAQLARSGGKSGRH